ncbi:MAG: EF-hand domain-containing protein [Pseudomonadota bacterium]
MTQPSNKTVRRLLLTVTTVFLASASIADAQSSDGKKNRTNPDTNGDGLISREEFEAVSQGRLAFEDIDTNGDGYIDADERATLRERMRERMRDRERNPSL